MKHHIQMNLAGRRWFGLLLLAAWLVPLATGLATPHWFSATTVNGQTRPLSAGPASTGAAKDLAAASERLIDVVISLHNNPVGDNNGNVQDQDPHSDLQDQYERMVQYFADGVYESTEGRHKLRNVRLYTNGKCQNTADVKWKLSGNPSCSKHVNTNGLHTQICMYDIFPNSVVFTNRANNEAGGYCLAHEWGHYFYGIYDDYCLLTANSNNIVSVSLPEIEKNKPSIMNHPWNATGRNYNWLNFSIAWQGHTAPGGVDDYAPYEDRGKSSQYQVRARSAWEMLALKQTNDPAAGFALQVYSMWYGQYFPRVYYPEIAAVAPVGTAAPTINLSSNDSLSSLPSRSALNIMWMNTNVVLELVIDNSPGMYSGSRIDYAKMAAKAMVDTVASGSAVEVIAFNGVTYPGLASLYPMTFVTNDTIRTNIKNAIDTLTTSYSGGKALGWTCAQVLDRMNTFGHSNYNRAVFLMTDYTYFNPEYDTTHPTNVIPYYQEAQIPIMTFGYGDSANADLFRLSWETGGKYYVAPDSLAAVMIAFRDAYGFMEDVWMLAQGSHTVPYTRVSGKGTVTIPFAVDATIADLSATLAYNINDTVSATLRAPDNTAYYAAATNQVGDQREIRFHIAGPAVGQWRYNLAASAGASISYQVMGEGTSSSYYLDASAAGQSTATYPVPLNIVATLDKDRAINGARVTAKISNTNGTVTTLPLTNAGAGVYLGYYPAANGFYDVLVQADNSNAQAYLTSAGTMPACLPDGSLPESVPDEPIAENFLRTASFQVTVTNVPADLVAPGSPNGLTASAGTYGSSVMLAWNAVTNAQIYEVWRNTVDQSAGAGKIGEVAYNWTSYADCSAGENATYYYWVKARNAAGTGEFSASACGWVLAPPTGLAAAQGLYSHQVPLSWNSSASAESYSLYRAPLNDLQLAERLINTTSTSYMDTSPDTRTNYCYWLSLTCNSNASSFCGPIIGSCHTLVSPVADFDGDRKADPALYDEATGIWRIKFSGYNYADFSSTLNNLGGPGYCAIAADFDGDRKADPATYSTSSGDWKIMLSSCGYGLVSIPAFLGGSGWLPLAADFDGDTLADPAVYQEATGHWQIKLSSGGYQTIVLAAFMGCAGYEIFAADLDGDNKADPGAYQWSTGNWVVKQSSTGYTSMLVPGLLGGSSYYLRLGDFDGDGMADPTVYAPSTDEWKLKLSSMGYSDYSVVLTF